MHQRATIALAGQTHEGTELGIRDVLRGEAERLVPRPHVHVHVQLVQVQTRHLDAVLLARDDLQQRAHAVHFQGHAAVGLHAGHAQGILRVIGPVRPQQRLDLHRVLEDVPIGPALHGIDVGRAEGGLPHAIKHHRRLLRPVRRREGSATARVAHGRGSHVRLNEGIVDHRLLVHDLRGGGEHTVRDPLTLYVTIATNVEAEAPPLR
mmetsp:Transcript_9604/g.29956  ORF Transcript_9604/g.29956 Transcript_9604/m.29956 type:complete len:207 (+) Transcript_9604:689-1309(+)